MRKKYQIIIRCGWNLFIDFLLEVQMAEKLDKSETVDLVEALKMEMIINQALMDLLISKGIITEEEMMAKIKAVKESMGYQESN